MSASSASFPPLMQPLFNVSNSPDSIQQLFCLLVTDFFKNLLIFLFTQFLSLIYLVAPSLQLGHVNSQLQHVGSSSLIRNGTWAPCIGSSESQPLDTQGSPVITDSNATLQLSIGRPQTALLSALPFHLGDHENLLVSKFPLPLDQ